MRNRGGVTEPITHLLSVAAESADLFSVCGIEKKKKYQTRTRHTRVPQEETGRRRNKKTHMYFNLNSSRRASPRGIRRQIFWTYA